MRQTPWNMTTTEFEFMIPGHPEPYAVIRRLRLQGKEVYRAVTWAPTSGARELIGYADGLDRAAELLWRRYCDESNARHEVASRTHGGAERSARAHSPGGR